MNTPFIYEINLKV